jgi:hypothetical protein
VPSVLGMFKINVLPRRATAAVALAIVPVMLAAGCTKAKVVPPKPIINEYVTGVQVDGQTAKTTVETGQLPDGTGAGPAITVPTDATVVNGGSLREPITASKDFVKVRMAIQPVASPSTSTSPSATTGPTANPPTTGAPLTPPVAPSGPPAQGFYEVTLASAASSANLVVSLAQTLPGTAFVFHYALVGADGSQGAAARQVIDAIPVGTGQVQVSVSWDVDSDVDLHVVDPDKGEVYWDNTSVASGGELDLDSNADCDLDHKKNENITWSHAPAGTFTVRLDLFEECDTTATNYVVTVRVSGQAVRTFSGKFTGKGDLGGEGDGIPITTFQIAPAPSSS